MTQFQATKFEKEDIKKLVQSLNKQLGERSLDIPVLEKTFDIWWPVLETDIKKVLEQELISHEPVRGDHDILIEILELSRLSVSRKFSREQQTLANQVYAELKGSANTIDQLAGQLAEAAPDAYDRVRLPMRDTWSKLILIAKIVANIDDPSSVLHYLALLSSKRQDTILEANKNEDN